MNPDYDKVFDILRFIRLRSSSGRRLVGLSRRLTDQCLPKLW